MKCDLTNTVLTFVLGALAVAGVICALQTIFLNRELQTLTPTITQANAKLMMMRSFVSDVSAYNAQAKSPEITRLLQSIQPKQAPAK